MSLKSIISDFRVKIARSSILPQPVKRVAKAAYYSLIPSSFRESNVLYHTIKALNESSARSYLQVGASDGVKDDPLFPFSSRDKWTGVMVEPNPVSFDNLQKNHSATPSDIEFVNCAIGEAGTFTLYWCAEDPGMGSTDYEMAKRSADSRGYNLNKTDVEMIPFETLVSEYPRAKRVDLLLIDTEGWDCDIVLSINFEAFSAETIVYEAVHIAEDKQRQAWEYLEKKGYTCFTCKDDVVAIRRDSNNAALQKILKNGHRL